MKSSYLWAGDTSISPGLRDGAFKAALATSATLLFIPMASAQQASATATTQDAFPETIAPQNPLPPNSPAAPSSSAPAATGSTRGAQGDGYDGDIVVTALRRNTNIQQTPLAISAVSAQRLSDMGIVDSSDLAKSVPNLVVRPNSNGGSRLTIRNIYASGEPVVGLYYDDTPLTGTIGVSSDAGGNTPDINLFDVERVEVLRGPQGTLYGAGSMAGTVRMIFAKPDLVNYGGSLNGQMQTVDGGGVGYTLQGEANIPIVQDVLAVRAVGFYQYQNGWLENSLLDLHNFNDSKSYGGRLLLRFKPASNLTIDGLAVLQDRHGFRSNWNYDVYTGRDSITGPRRKYDQYTATATPQKDKMQLYSGTVNWDFGLAKLTAVGSYSKRNVAYNFDYTPYFVNKGKAATNTTPGCLQYFGIASGGACSDDQVTQYKSYIDGIIPITAYQPQYSDTSTEEIRLANDKHSLQWTIGAYHSYRKSFVNSVLNTTDPETGKMVFPYQQQYARTVLDILEQSAIYGEATYDVTKKLSVTGGIRWFNYKKKDVGTSLQGNPVVGNYALPPDTARASESGVVLKFNADYKLTKDFMFFASASQGFRPGGVNESVGLPAGLAPYKSDSLWDYEIGLKSAWFDHNLIFNLDLFQIDWKNLQVSASSNDGAFGFITNAGKVRVRGVEFESTMRPLRDLTLHVSGSYSIAKLQGDEIAPPGIVILGAGHDGDFVPYSPKWTLQEAADYTIPLNDDLDVLLHGDITYQSSAWTQFARTDPYLYKLPGYALTGLRVGIQRHDGKWGASLFVSNLLNVTGFTSKSVSASTGNMVTVISTLPRTVGINLRTTF